MVVFKERMERKVARKGWPDQGAERDQGRMERSLMAKFFELPGK